MRLLTILFGVFFLMIESDLTAQANSGSWNRDIVFKSTEVSRRGIFFEIGDLKFICRKDKKREIVDISSIKSDLFTLTEFEDFFSNLKVDYIEKFKHLTFYVFKEQNEEKGLKIPIEPVWVVEEPIDN